MVVKEKKNSMVFGPNTHSQDKVETSILEKRRGNKCFIYWKLGWPK